MKLRLVNDVTSVAEFLAKYYKPERYTGRGEEYARLLFENDQREYETTGYTSISHFDSVTGEFLFFGILPSWAAK